MNKTQEKIINAFWSLAKDKEINEITIKDISKKAGINRSTFYNYFFDMNDLIEQIENSGINDIVNKANNYLTSNEIDYEISFQFISDLFANYEEYIYIFLIKNNHMRFYEKLKDNFFPIVEKKVLINTNIENFDYITAYMFNSILGLITHWYNTNKEMPLEEFVNLMFSLVKEGANKYIK